MVLALVLAVDHHEFLAQSLIHHRMIAHCADRAEHVLGKVDAALAVFVQRRNRLFTRIQAMFHAGEDRRQHQIGVGVGAGQAVFDAQVFAV